jgi:PKD repeat protein
VSSTLSNPTISYATAGTYTITLTAIGTSGCTATSTQTVTVLAKPTASFSANNVNGCTTNNTVSFTNNSSNANSYSWSFGDNIGSTLTNPTHQFASQGSYQITLIAFNNNACSDTARQTINSLLIPTANFSVNRQAQCVRGNNFIFSATPYTNATYTWNFGDGTNVISTNSNSVNKQFTGTGNFTVTLTISITNNCSATTQQIVSVAVNPVASFVVNNATQCTSNNRFEFTNTSTNATSFLWDFADSNGAVTNNATRVYQAAGTYSVLLIASNNAGCSDTARGTITVVPKPLASFALAATNFCTNTNFTFNNTNIQPNTAYTWRFNDGTILSSNNATKTFANAGVNTVQLVAVNANGCRDSATQSINIGIKPIPNFTATATNACSTDFLFTNTTVGNVFSSTWDFGNGNFSTLSNPVNSYSVSQNYFVKLKVESILGCADSIIKQVMVYPKLNVSYTQNSLIGCQGNNNFNFTSKASAGSFPIRNEWSFGDGTTALGVSVNKTYTLPGIYSVKLVAINIETGCRDSITQFVTVYPRPSATIAGGTTVCNGTSAILTVRFTGAAPYSFIYTDGTRNYTVTDLYDSVYSLNVTPSLTATYRLINMADRFCTIAETDLPSRAIVEVKNIYFQNQPQDVNTCIGKRIVLRGRAYSDNTTFTYQWLKDGLPIVGATRDSLVLNSAVSNDLGFYRLTAVTTCGTFSSNPVAVRVDALPMPPTFMSNYTYCQFTAATPLSATGNLITWYANQNDFAGSTIAPTPSTLQAGTYQYWVSNTATPSNCESQRFAVTTTVLPAPTITYTSSGSNTLLPNTTTTLQAVASANTAGVRWYYNGLYMGLTPNNRVLVDFNRTGKYYAEAITLDGCKAITDTINVTKNLGAAPSISGDNLVLYPNPVERMVNVYFNNPINQNAKIRVVDMLGYVRREINHRYTTANQPVTIDLAGLPTGTYVVEVLNVGLASIARGKVFKR